MAEHRPEGTDAIIAGAGVGDDEGDTAVAGGFGDGEFAGGDAANETDTRTATPAHTGGAADAPAETQAGPRIDNENKQDAAPAEPVSFSTRVEALRGQAGDQARDFAVGLKERATGSLDDVVRLIEDTAGEVDAKLGSHYGDYVRRASAGVAGLSEQLKGKDVDALVAEAGEFVRRAPGVAVGVAATVGFLLARVARAGLGDAPPAKGGEAA